jgi:hypothetical protein
MKASNKILAGGFFTIILGLLAVNVALYARYKAGNYVPYSEKENAEATQVKEFANARSIDIRFLSNVVVRIGNRMKIEQYGENNGDVVLTEQGGRVELFLKDSIGSERMFKYVIVYVPENSTISSYKAHIRVDGQNGEKIHHLNFIVSGGQIDFERPKSMLNIDSLSVDAANQAVIELKNAQIRKMSVQLNASELTDHESDIQELKLNTDSASRINLQTKNFLNLTNKTTVHE